jgi:site-specific recombinase XerD
MNASISVVCYKSKTLSNGEHPLMLQISKHGKRKYQSLGISIHADNWDFLKNKPKPNCPDGEYIQKIISDKILEIQKQILEYTANGKDYTPTGLLKGNTSAVNEKSVGEFYNELILTFEKTDKTGNRLIYKTSYNSIKVFNKGRLNLLFSDIDVNWLNRYEKWLRSKGNKETTMSLLFRTLRSAYNKAVEAKCARKTDYPFDEYKVSRFDVKTKKRAIIKEDMMKIMKLDLADENDSIKFSRDIFIFSYLCGGINFSDIANLKQENIGNDRIQYIRQKTGKLISIHLSEESSNILSQYKGATDVRGYLFPILDIRVHKTAQQKQNRIHKILGRIDKDLKRIAEKCSIGQNLTTYSARHSFATILKNSGVNVALISEVLGHSDLSTTQIYLDSFENNQIDDAMLNLL